MFEKSPAKKSRINGKVVQVKAHSFKCKVKNPPAVLRKSKYSNSKILS